MAHPLQRSQSWRNSPQGRGYKNKQNATHGPGAFDHLPRPRRVTNAMSKATILYAQSPSKFEGLVACK
jgi:hypothetical protein